MKNWFENWFNSEYYHILYDHRNEDDAKDLIQCLVAYLKPSKNDVFLDLACGKGRHSILLNQLGYQVYGCDIGIDNIALANEHASETLHFFQHDMRQPLPQQYNYVLNLFTSFGYFETDQEHIDTLQHIGAALKPGGTLVIDFLNIFKIVNELIPEEIIIKGGITFHISRKINENGFLIKEITFSDEGKDFQFQEKVRAFTQDDFIQMLKKTGFNCSYFAGDYHFEKFSINNSPRLIIIADKC